MAPVFIARHLNSKEVSSPLYKLKGANGWAPAAPSSLAFLGLPLRKEVAYDGYKSNVDAFVAATNQQKKVFCGADAFGFNPRGTLPIREPVCKFSLKKELTADHRGRLIAKLGEKASYEVLGKTAVYSCPDMSEDNLVFILRLCNESFNAGPGAVNPQGLVAFRFLSGFLDELLATHTYPAFTSDPRHDNLLTVGGFMPNANSPVTHITYQTDEKKKEKLDEKLGMASLMYPDEEEDDEEEEEDSEMNVDGKKKKEEKGFGDYYEKRQGLFTMTLQDMVFTAKPSPGSASNNIGLTSAIPELPGLVLPFFNKMHTFDDTYLRRFIYTYAFRLLGTSAGDCQTNFSSMKRGLNSLMGTEAGEAILHMCYSADLAIQTQTRLYLVIEDFVYHGAAILGSGFGLYNGSSWMKALSARELREDILALSPHKNAVEKLRAALVTLASSEHYTGSTSFESIENPEDLIPLFSGFRLEGAEEGEVTDLNNALRSLNFRKVPYRTLNTPDEVIWFLKQYFSTDPVKLAHPCYIPSSKVDLQDRAFVLLSQFGPDAPSLWNTKGVEYPCVAEDETTMVDGKRKKSGEKNMFANLPEAILITPKPLQVAVNDWKTVLGKRAVKMDLKERAGRNRNKGISSEEVRKVIWKLLVEGVAKENVVSKKAKKNVDPKTSFDEELMSFLN